MEIPMTFLECPAYLGGQGGVQCGLPAEVEYRYSIGSTDGPLESAKIRCPRGHWFNGPIDSLIPRDIRQAQVAGRPAPVSPATRAAGRHA
jgi:hypothetical protein